METLFLLKIRVYSFIYNYVVWELWSYEEKEFIVLFTIRLYGNFVFIKNKSYSFIYSYVVWELCFY
jgi:hypothetical protein